MSEAQTVFMDQGILYNNLHKSVAELIRINHGYATESRKVRLPPTTPPS